ncbi:MAG: UDP-N-acetylmuramoyl-tripeptide--D-alanyl-D-alanine ligase [Sphingobacteriales bacterium]|nr:UDP-N-acetylmuramoyl-tripeptide--D-alanyl-D-alanine ligase [Sphingobacteriales bacterium]MBI3717048.1 UDP-N-acetylmuramoyl-tripeptide--D-alanyl-D-alanine ligase [Sphingobacteriales bacterium]
MTIEQLYSIYLKYPFLQTDTRKLKAGDLFFALKGENFNGNLFAKQALEKGAAYAVVDENVDEANERIIKTDDVLTTLQRLAKYHRKQFNIPFLAITGSNGKTTTKELIHAVLSLHYKTYTTEGNLNNHIGVPLTLLKIKSDAQMAVIEMGANHQKEIASYCTYALPNYGLINNCGKAHLEGFGGVEGVRKGKGELYDHIRNNGGSIFINNDYDYLKEMSKGIDSKISYGTADAETTGHLLESEPFLKVIITSDESIGTIQTQLVGDYNLPNVLAAVAAGKYFKVPADKIRSAIENYIPSNSRSQLIEKGSNKIILDAYNANPSSMKAAIENFAKIHADKKILLLGGMAELGEESMAEHMLLINLISKYKWSDVVLVGGDFGKVPHQYHYFPNVSAAKEWYTNAGLKNTYMLVKGSRSFKMEQLVD